MVQKKVRSVLAIVPVVALGLVVSMSGGVGLSVGAQDAVPVYLMNLTVRAEPSQDAGTLTARIDVCVDDETQPSWRDLDVGAALPPVPLTPAEHAFRVFTASSAETCQDRQDPLVVEMSDLAPAEGAVPESLVLALVPAASAEAEAPVEFRVMPPADYSFSCPGGIAWVNAVDSSDNLEYTEVIFRSTSGQASDYNDFSLSPAGVRLPDLLDVAFPRDTLTEAGTFTWNVALKGTTEVQMPFEPVQIDPSAARTFVFAYGGPTSSLRPVPDEGELPDQGDVPDEGEVPVEGEPPDQDDVADEGAVPDVGDVPDESDVAGVEAAQEEVVYGTALLEVPVDCPNQPTTTTTTTSATATVGGVAATPPATPSRLSIAG